MTTASPTVEKATLRKLKDGAADAFEQGRYRDAAMLYDRIAAVDHDPTWRLRAGEALRRAGELRGAVERLHDAALGYARAGFSGKAAAICTQLRALAPGALVERLVDEVAALDAQRLAPRPLTPRRLEAVPAPRK